MQTSGGRSPFGEHSKLGEMYKYRQKYPWFTIWNFAMYVVNERKESFSFGSSSVHNLVEATF